MVDELREFSSKSSPEAWIRQGYRMIQKQLYEQALSCFMNGNHEEMASVCRAYILADKAVELAKLTKKEAIPLKNKEKLSKKKLKEMRKQVEQTFTEAGETFKTVGKFREAAKCFYSGKQFDKARELFENLNLQKDTAECYFMMGEYQKAAQLYELLKDYPKQIECLDLMGDWEAILRVMAEHRDHFEEEERNSIVAKYCNLAYGKLMREIQTDFLQEAPTEEVKQTKQV